MDHTGRIDLAHAPALTLGRLSVRPATRELVRDDGETETLEPKVMQVLVALLQADGGILSRDDLIAACWEGRIVSEDAINRVISRLRRSADGIAEGGFRVDTITKVGYRLVPADASAAAPEAAAVRAPPAGPGRRGLLLGAAGVAAVALAGGAAWLWRRSQPPTPPPEVAPLLEQARIALYQSTREGQNQAIGLSQRVVELAPDYADGWGLLGLAYVKSGRYRATAENEALRARGRAAGLRALALDRDNGYGAMAVAAARPARGNWREVERAARRGLLEHPRDTMVRYDLGQTLSSVGRNVEAASVFDAMVEPPTPEVLFAHTVILWSANRLEDVDRMTALSARLYPTHFANWFARFYTLMYSGRPGQAVAMAQDVEHRPSGIPDSEIARVVEVARAIQSRSPTDIEAVMRVELAMAHQGSGFAENTIQFASALGRLDEAFSVAEAYYFSRGFDVPEVRFTAEQGTYLRREDRLTNFLFNPATAPMRADPRFDRLVDELGLKRYWATSGATPDYQRRGA